MKCCADIVILIQERGSEPPAEPNSGWCDGGTLGRISLQRHREEKQWWQEEQEEGGLYRKSKLYAGKKVHLVVQS